METCPHFKNIACQLLRVSEVDDRTAFTKLYAEHRRPVHDFLASHEGAHSPHELEEMVQEVFLRAWRSRHSFRRESSTKTYLFSIAINVLREGRRYARRQRTVALAAVDDVAASADSVADVEKAIDLPQLVAAIESDMAGLSERQREAIRLVVIEGRTHVEAARLANASPNAMQHRLNAALRRLRQSLAACPPEQCPLTGRPPLACPAQRSGIRCVKYAIWNYSEK